MTKPKQQKAQDTNQEAIKEASKEPNLPAAKAKLAEVKKGPFIGSLIEPVFNDLLTLLSRNQKIIIECVYIDGNSLADARAALALPMDQFDREYNGAINIMFNALVTKDAS